MSDKIEDGTDQMIAEVRRDKYMLPTEKTWSETLHRFANGIFYDDVAKKSRLAELLETGVLSPAGRPMAGIGSGRNVTAVNCFSAVTSIVTSDIGVVRLGDVTGESFNLPTKVGNAVPAVIRSFGSQWLRRITFAPAIDHPRGIRRSRSNVRVVHEATRDHRWILSAGGETTLLKIGDVVPACAYSPDCNSDVYKAGFRHGLIFGDGAMCARHPRTGFDEYSLRLCGDKNKKYVVAFDDLIEKNDGRDTNHERARIDSPPSFEGDVRVFFYSKVLLKELPIEGLPSDYYGGFVHGWFAADGHYSPRDNSFMITGQDHNALDWLREHAVLANWIVSGDTTSSVNETNYGKRSAPLRFVRLRRPDMTHWQVVEIEEDIRKDKVYCAVVPSVGAFTLGSGVYTGNCFVINDIEDSMRSENGVGIMDTLARSAYTMQMGGGIGLCFSSIRPKGAEVAKIGADASGPLSFMDMWDAMCRTIMSAGYRRGAMMATLHCDHPDIEAFIEAKSDGKRLRMFNLSVLITDEFMKAVDDDGDWQLGHFKPPHGKNVEVTPRGGKRWYIWRTVKARALWERIMRNTYVHAEPGVIFIDRVNNLSNLSYCEHVTASNPCQPAFAPVLTPNGLSTLGQIEVGDAVWSEDGWVTVERKWSTGVKVVRCYRTTAGVFYGTANHCIVARGEKVSVGNAEAIDRLAGPGVVLSHDTSIVMDGLVIGDGSAANQRCVDKVYLTVGENDQDYFSSEVRDLLVAPHPAKYERAWVIKTSILPEELPTLPNRVIPLRYAQADFVTMASVLRGLYSANGSVVGNAPSGFRVTLKTTSFGLVEQVQVMLSALGIPSYFTTNKSKAVVWANGTYVGRESYDVNITAAHCERFLSVIGFLQKYKCERLSDLLSQYGGAQRPTKTFSIISDTEIGEMEVFDITVSGSSHTYWTGGCNVSNCGEQMLPANGDCNLGHVNLAACVKNPLTPQAHWDFDLLRPAVQMMVRVLDRIVDLSLYPLDEQKEEALAKRRIGLGVTGLGNALEFLRLRYGSDAAVRETSRIMGYIANAAYASSVNLAKAYGAFPMFNKKAFLDAPFIQKLDANVKNGIENFGIRNGMILSIAPTGTNSIAQCDNCSSGIEPVFDHFYNRKVLQGDGSTYKEYRVSDHGYRMFRRTFGEDAPLPDYMVTANQLTPEQHVKMLAAAQEWVDNSISKTVNCPSSMTFEEFQKVYDLAYSLGCKACSTYRPDPASDRGSVLSAATVTNEVTIDHKTGTVSISTNMAPAIARRPEELEGRTYKIRWPHLEEAVYMTVNDIELPEGKRPFEIFLSTKAVRHVEWMTIFTRLVSAVFRRGGDVTFLLDEMRQVQSAEGGAFIGERMFPSLVALIGSTLGKHFERIGLLEQKSEQPSSLEICPRCNARQYVKSEGCGSCLACHYSTCG